MLAIVRTRELCSVVLNFAAAPFSVQIILTQKDSNTLSPKLSFIHLRRLHLADAFFRDVLFSG